MKTRAQSKIKALAIVSIALLPIFALAHEVAPKLLPSKGSLHKDSGASFNSQTVALLGNNAQVIFSRGGGSVEIIDVSALKSTQGKTSEGNLYSNKSGNISMYVVREGDSLGQIAEMFGVSTNTIIWANDLSGNTITPGKTLIILPMSGVRHQVESGDTVESLAKKYNGDADEIREFNGFSDSAELAVDDFVNIPDGEVEKSVAKNVASSSGGSWLIPPLASYVKTQHTHGYNAVDMAAPVGTTVMASAAGTVITAKNDEAWNGGYGNYVVIKHSNGVQTLYAHFGPVVVGVGQQVVQGQVLGYLGMTGKTTGPHIHFEVRGGTNPF